jgi:uroporphyrinogen-III decarboxylase
VRKEQWESFKSAVRGTPEAGVPVALIMDSPWIPGYLGISHLDYYVDPEAWFQGNIRVIEEFPDIIVFPSWWVEYGMAIEPSAVGARISFRRQEPPSISSRLFRLEDVRRLAPVDPECDGLMAWTLARYRMQVPRILDAGFVIPIVTARGPLCTAAFLRGLTDFMMDLVETPELVHDFLDYTTDLTIAWLRAQAEAIGRTVEALFILDDIVGFLSPRHYQEFAEPCLKRITSAFPEKWIKIYHNDANISPFLEQLPHCGFDVLNLGKNLDIAEVDRRTGGRFCLMGNVNPLEIATFGSAEDVRKAGREVLGKARGTRLILSYGGGVSPGTPPENIRALAQAARDFRGC